MHEINVNGINIIFINIKLAFCNNVNVAIFINIKLV